VAIVGGQKGGLLGFYGAVGFHSPPPPPPPGATAEKAPIDVPKLTSQNQRLKRDFPESRS
jgi:hypothetical protein